jgi:hypothetical protein
MEVPSISWLQSSSAERPEALKILSDVADGSLLQSHSLCAGFHWIRTRKETIFAAVHEGSGSALIGQLVSDVFELAVEAPVGQFDLAQQQKP